MRDEFVKLNMTAQELRIKYLEPLGEREPGNPTRQEEKELRLVSSHLWNYNNKIHIIRIYILRCIILVVSTSATLVYAIYSFCFLRKDGSEFKCVSKSALLAAVHGNTIGETYACFHAITAVMLGSFLILIISLIGQLLLIIVGITKVSWRKKTLQTKAESQETHAKFMGTFWKNSQPERNNCLSDFIEYVYKKDTVRQMGRRVTQAVHCWDYEYLSAYSILCGEGTGVVEILKKKWKTKMAGPDAVDENLETKIIETLKITMYTTRECVSFVGLLSKKKRWRLLVGLLDFSVDEAVSFLNSLTLFYGIPSNDSAEEKEVKKILSSLNLDEHGCSLLYYALRDDPSRERCQAANLILENAKDGRQKYVHNDGSTISASKFVSSHQVCNVIEESEKSTKEPNPNESHDRIEELLNEHKTKTSALSSNEEAYKNYLSKFAETLSRYKFQNWDNATKALVSFANEEKQWIVFVALLNAYVVNDKKSERSELQNCGVSNFAPNPILGLVLKKQPYQNTFIPTAARHILRCIRTDQSKVTEAVNIIGEENLEINEDERKSLLCTLRDQQEVNEDNSQTAEPLTHPQASTAPRNRRWGFACFPSIAPSNRRWGFACFPPTAPSGYTALPTGNSMSTSEML